MNNISLENQLQCAFKSHPGKKRRVNEDSCAVVVPPDCAPPIDCILIVSDGMGGAGGGDVASSVTVQVISSTILASLSDCPNAPVEGVLLDAAAAANTAVRQRREQGGRLAEMGATAVCAVISGNSATIANVGDSRCYLLHGSNIRLLTKDHSVVWDEMLEGRLTRDEAERSRYRNVITRAIGVSEQVDTDIVSQALIDGDRLLLCSDGVTTELSDQDIAAIVSKHASTEMAVNQLVEAVLNTEARDNFTIVLADYCPINHACVQEPPDAVPVAPSDRHIGISRNRTVWYLLEHMLLFASILVACFLGRLVYMHRTVATKALMDAPPMYVPHAGAITTGTSSLSRLPVLFAKGTFRPDVLAVDGPSLYLASKSGTLTGYDIASSKELPPIPGFKLDAPEEALPKSALPDVIFTAHGNRFQISVTTDAVQEFNNRGVLIATSLGKGILTHPTRLAYVPHVGLMVLDQNKVWKFPILAKDATKKDVR